MPKDIHVRLNRIGGVAMAVGVYCVYSGMVVWASPHGVLGEPQLAWVFDHVPRLVLVIAHEVLGLALLLSIQKESRLFIAMVACACFFLVWALIAAIPTVTQGIKGGSGLEFGFYAVASAYSVHLAREVRRLRAEGGSA